MHYIAMLNADSPFLPQLFEVILCSLGDAVYVEEMRAVLDPTGDIIVRAYSCRRKFEALKAQYASRDCNDWYC